MSREIKFRAWDADSGKMFQPDGIFNGKPFLEGPPERSVTVYDCPIMQYTGLKDADGVEIYEGDIVEWLTLKYPITVSEQHGYRFMFGKDILTRAQAVNGRVIGNIHQNPELLK